MKKLGSVFAWVSAALLLQGCMKSEPEGIPISAEQYGSGWPLTISTGKIVSLPSTHGRTEVIFVAPDGQKYGLNGTAQSAGFKSIHEITKFEEASYGKRYEDVSGLIRLGLTR